MKNQILAALALLLALAVATHAQDKPVASLTETATQFRGADIGAQVNAAIAALPGGCGTVLIPPVTPYYNFSTTIVKPRCVSLQGAGAASTILNWVPATGAAMVAADRGAGKATYPEGQVSQLTLQGRSPDNKGSIGLYIGGDPSGTLIAADAYGDDQAFSDIRILGFGRGIQWGNNAWANNFDNLVITLNGIGIDMPPALNNTGESLVFHRTSIQNSTVQGINQIGYAFFQFHGCRFDYNATGGTVAYAAFYGTHFEQKSGTILTLKAFFNPVLIIDSGEAFLEAGTGSDAQMFEVDSSMNPTFILRGTQLAANHTVTTVVNWHGAGLHTTLSITDLPFYELGKHIMQLVNAECNFHGCYVNDASNTGNVVTGANLTVGGIKQNHVNTFAGSCSMSGSNTCSFPVSTTFMNYLCFPAIDHASSPPAQSINATCSLTGNTATVTAGERNSLKWDAMFLGNPN